MLSDLVKLAAEKARDAAEEYFKLQNIDMAIKSLQAAKDFNPHLPNIEEYFTAYKVHQLAAKKPTSWYEFLAITDPETDTSVIRKHYKRLALMLHPDKNTSVAADCAFKLIQSALDVLTNPEKREAYDSRFGSSEGKPADSSWSDLGLQQLKMINSSLTTVGSVRRKPKLQIQVGLGLSLSLQQLMMLHPDTKGQTHQEITIRATKVTM